MMNRRRKGHGGAVCVLSQISEGERLVKTQPNCSAVSRSACVSLILNSHSSSSGVLIRLLRLLKASPLGFSSGVLHMAIDQS